MGTRPSNSKPSHIPWKATSKKSSMPKQSLLQSFPQRPHFQPFRHDNHKAGAYFARLLHNPTNSSTEPTGKKCTSLIQIYSAGQTWESNPECQNDDEPSDRDHCDKGVWQQITSCQETPGKGIFSRPRELLLRIPLLTGLMVLFCQVRFDITERSCSFLTIQITEPKHNITQELSGTKSNMPKLVLHEKAVNLARRWSVQNENDLMQVRDARCRLDFFLIWLGSILLGSCLLFSSFYLPGYSLVLVSYSISWWQSTGRFLWYVICLLQGDLSKWAYLTNSFPPFLQTTLWICRRSATPMITASPWLAICSTSRISRRNARSLKTSATIWNAVTVIPPTHLRSWARSHQRLLGFHVHYIFVCGLALHEVFKERSNFFGKKPLQSSENI